MEETLILTALAFLLPAGMTMIAAASSRERKSMGTPTGHQIDDPIY